VISTSFFFVLKSRGLLKRLNFFSNCNKKCKIIKFVGHILQTEIGVQFFHGRFLAYVDANNWLNLFNMVFKLRED